MKDNIHTLLEKYFEGTSSLQEEQELREYFSRENIEDDLKVYQPIFRFFTLEKESVSTLPKKEEKKTRRLIFRISIGAAACLALLFSIHLFLATPESGLKNSYAYIDGKRYTDMQMVRLHALESIESLSEGDESVLSSQIEMLDSLFE